MTVKELIAKLNKFDQDKVVCVYNTEYSDFYKVGDVVEVSKSGYLLEPGYEYDGILIDEGGAKLKGKRRKE